MAILPNQSHEAKEENEPTSIVPLPKKDSGAAFAPIRRDVDFTLKELGLTAAEAMQARTLLAHVWTGDGDRLGYVYDETEGRFPATTADLAALSPYTSPASVRLALRGRRERNRRAGSEARGLIGKGILARDANGFRVIDPERFLAFRPSQTRRFPAARTMDHGPNGPTVSVQTDPDHGPNGHTGLVQKGQIDARIKELEIRKNLEETGGETTPPRRRGDLWEVFFEASCHVADLPERPRSDPSHLAKALSGITDKQRAVDRILGAVLRKKPGKSGGFDLADVLSCKWASEYEDAARTRRHEANTLLEQAVAEVNKRRTRQSGFRYRRERSVGTRIDSSDRTNRGELCPLP